MNMAGSGRWYEYGRIWPLLWIWLDL